VPLSPHILHGTDLFLTLPQSITTDVEHHQGLQRFEVPMAIKPFAIQMVWHERFDTDPANR